jgi:hypothetical protein
VKKVSMTSVNGTSIEFSPHLRVSFAACVRMRTKCTAGKVGLVYDLLELQQLILAIIANLRPLSLPEILLRELQEKDGQQEHWLDALCRRSNRYRRPFPGDQHCRSDTTAALAASATKSRLVVIR